MEVKLINTNDEVSNELKKKKTTISSLLGKSDENVEGNCSKNYLASYLTQREANGYTKMSFENKQGSHYVELKIYECDEIENVSAMNRWRHSIFNLKNRTNIDSPAWQHLIMFLTAVNKEYEGCRKYPVSNNYN